MSDVPRYIFSDSDNNDFTYILATDHDAAMQQHAAELAAVGGKSQEFHRASMNNYPHGTVEAMQRWYKAQKELGIVLANPPAAARVLLDELDRHRKAHVLCEAGDPLDVLEQLMDDNLKIQDKLVQEKHQSKVYRVELGNQCQARSVAEGELARVKAKELDTFQKLKDCGTAHKDALIRIQLLEAELDPATSEEAKELTNLLREGIEALPEGEQQARQKLVELTLRYSLLKAHTTALRGALESLLKYFGKWPSYVVAPEYRDAAIEAIKTAQAALRQGEDGGK